MLFQRSSVVEQSAVNRSVVGSSPTAGAIKKKTPLKREFFLRKRRLLRHKQSVVVLIMILIYRREVWPGGDWFLIPISTYCPIPVICTPSSFTIEPDTDSTGM